MDNISTMAMTEITAETQDAKDCDLIKRDLLSQLERTWHSTIPVSEFMQITPVSFINNKLLVTAPLGPNLNLHQTMFAGSIYTLMTLTGWGMVWLQLKLAGIDGDIVLADAKIKYHAPVTIAPVSQVTWPKLPEQQTTTSSSVVGDDFAYLYSREKISHHLEVHLYSGKKLCATFNGRYVSIKKPA
jgi:thioesterase domain-containing protein